MKNNESTAMTVAETTDITTSGFVNAEALALLQDVMAEDAAGLEFQLDRIKFAAGGTTILASFAQEESTSLSNNIKWTFQKKYQEGRVHSHQKMYGYRWNGDEMEIVPEEAEIVRFIFDSYIGGMSSGEITKELNRQGVKGVRGKAFPQESVVLLLQNEQYTGCLLLQRYYNLEPHKERINRGEMPMYRIDDHHPAIISAETFAAAMAVKAQRGNAATAKRRMSDFSKKVVCGLCGRRAAAHHTTSARRDPDRIYWVCNARHDKTSDCKCPYTRDDKLHEAADALGLAMNTIDRVMLHENKIVFSLTNGRTATWKQP